MAGLMSKVARFARRPQGRKGRAKRASADPKKQKIKQLRGRISRKRP